MFEKFNFNLLYGNRDDLTPLVVMMCGVSGSGKTTFSRLLEMEGFCKVNLENKYTEDKNV